MDFNEEVAKVLGNAELDEQAKTAEIAKITGQCFVSRDKHNKEIAEKDTALNSTKKEYEDFKQSKMTDEEKSKAILEKAEQENYNK
jgi:hypothetical protein